MSTKVEEYLGWTKGLFGSEEDRRLSSEEITALIKYASERGIGSEGLLGDLSDALYDYEIAENQKKTKAQQHVQYSQITVNYANSPMELQARA